MAEYIAIQHADQRAETLSVGRRQRGLTGVLPRCLAGMVPHHTAPVEVEYQPLKRRQQGLGKPSLVGQGIGLVLVPNPGPGRLRW